ncbi:MAG: NYN domain-containing protein [Gammaproteobacteria bacterium]|nr:NYN domain-containing protein [Gammaproteobacteria bacterium]
MKRVKCFVDGFNLYHAIADLKVNYLKWLNLRKLAEAFIKPTQEKLETVFYFSAYPTWLEGSYRRHQAYVKALEAMGVTAVIGHFKEKQRRCLKGSTQWCAHEEKQSDVNFAIHLLHQAHIDGFDKAFLVTADSDLCPVIDLVLDTFPEKELAILTPPNRYQIAREIRSKVTTIKIKQKHLIASLLQEKIYDGAGQLICTRPREYAVK